MFGLGKVSNQADRITRLEGWIEGLQIRLDKALDRSAVLRKELDQCERDIADTQAAFDHVGQWGEMLGVEPGRRYIERSIERLHGLIVLGIKTEADQRRLDEYLESEGVVEEPAANRPPVGEMVWVSRVCRSGQCCGKVKA
jgi:hypothetical protein